MQVQEFPQRPPDVPGPRPRHPPPVRAPIVYVRERQAWEYKVIIKKAAEEQSLSEHELNELGASGWELVGIVRLSGNVYYYLKRVRT